MHDRNSNHEMVSTALKALDMLRCSLDLAIETDNEHAAGLLIWAIRDLADTIDLITNDNNFPTHDGSDKIIRE